ncbi:MAG TPA: COQ9 family protein [Rhizomicrobium sp.]|jgi:ubiquinone biosynthesis protein COQ9|nr:COQ9 family protein [Rhizomicrobium sp.]
MIAKTARSGSRSRRKAAEPRDAVLAAALAHVPFDGFTHSVLAHAAKEAGISGADLKRLFPDGPVSLVAAFSEWADAEMVRELGRRHLGSLKIRERITLAVETRLAVIKPYKEAARRAAAFLMLPPHATTGVKLLYHTVDTIWRAVGDASTDFNFYTKRAILAGVYSTTLMRWFSDTSAGERDTSEFLRHRIDNVMTFEKFKAKVRERLSALPSLAEILNPDRRAETPRGSKAKGV